MKTQRQCTHLITICFEQTHIIGIIDVFSCINICRGSRKLFEPESARSRVQTAFEKHG